MTLTDLHKQISPLFPAYSRKDLKTAVHVLAHALGTTAPELCHPDHYTRPLAEITHRIEDYLVAQGKSGHTIRNTKNNVSRLFRLATAHGLFDLPPTVPTPRYTWDSKPSNPAYTFAHNNGIYLVYPRWPARLKA
jgi:hypothetical protein